MAPGPDLPRGSRKTKATPVRLTQDLFWPVGAPQRPDPETTSCPGCGSRQLTQRGSCAHCGTQRTVQPSKRNIYYVDVADMSTEEATSVVRSYRKELEGLTIQEALDTLSRTPTRGQWITR